jgi:hypothetical protein
VNPAPRIQEVRQLLEKYAFILARKMGFVALGWVVVYFVSQPMRWVPTNGGVNVLTLFGLLVGGFGGLVAGWYLATDAVQDSGMSGLALWVILVGGAVIPMLVVEGVLHWITAWPLNFGGYMMLMAAGLMAMASAVWHATAQE